MYLLGHPRNMFRVNPHLIMAESHLVIHNHSLLCELLRLNFLPFKKNQKYQNNNKTQKKYMFLM
jgi:hypothetical protein